MGIAALRRRKASSSRVSGFLEYDERGVEKMDITHTRWILFFYIYCNILKPVDRLGLKGADLCLGYVPTCLEIREDIFGLV